MEEKEEQNTDKDDYFYYYLDRTIRMIGKNPVETLRTKRVVIAGCGGVGGAACITLARMGVSKFILADPGEFDEPDINRQMGASKESLGRNKTKVYEEILHSINPDIVVKKYCDGVTDDNVVEIVKGSDLIIDCLDIDVPVSLRKKVYQLSWDENIPAIVAPVVGFGCIIAISAPGVMPLSAFGNVLDKAAEHAKLPNSFWDIFVPEHLQALGKALKELKAPTVAVSVQLATSIVCTEGLLFLAKDFPGWRPPTCLPKTIVIDLLRMNFLVLDINEYDKKYEHNKKDRSNTLINVKPELSNKTYKEHIAKVFYNTNLLSPDAIKVDMVTDSWRDIHPFKSQENHSEVNLIDKLKELYGYDYFIPVSQGRFAEALLTKSVIRPGDIVLTNALFPTTYFHLKSNGAEIINMSEGDTCLLNSSDNFKGNLSLENLNKIVNERENVRVIYLELSNNALGGHPISIENLREIYSLALDKGIFVFLDGTRAYDNASLIRERNQKYSEKKLVDIVHELSSCSHACAASLSKNFVSSLGAFVGTNDENIFNSVQDLAMLAYGSGLPKEQHQILANELNILPESNNSVKGRTALVKKLWKLLASSSIPIFEPVGGHAVFLNAAKFLEHIPDYQHPAQALVNALYIAGGIRSSVNLITPEQKERNVHLVRLSIPINYFNEAHIDYIYKVIKEVFDNKESVVGLNKTFARNGLGGEFTAHYQPVYKTKTASFGKTE